MKKKQKLSNFSYFDDCPICRAMKKAEKEGKELSEDELLASFEKAKKVGGIVGKAPDNDQPSIN